MTLSGAATQTLLTAVNFPPNAATQHVHCERCTLAIRMTFRLSKLGVNPKIEATHFQPSRSSLMSNAALDPTSIKTTHSTDTATVVRELIAAMPIVIFFKAARAALLQR